MNDFPTHYRVLRDQRHWDDAKSLAGLEARADGALLLKRVNAVRTDSGTLLVGPLDAGEGDVWERVWVEAEIPAETSVLLEVAASDDDRTPLGSLIWKRSPSLDVLMRTLVDGDDARFIWLCITLKSHDGLSTPQLLQVQASTPQPSYMDYLPAIYRRDDSTTGFLERWLALFRSELGDWDRTLEELPRQFDARTVDEADIGKLAAWLALDLPMRMDTPEQRQLLADAPAVYRQRGTPAGLREMVYRYIGAKIHIFEAFRERRVWRLGVGMGLGLDTALPAGTPGGMVVPGFTYADRRLSGLRGDYYLGSKFETLRHSQVDPELKFSSDENNRLDITQFLPPATLVSGGCSFRWSGQVQPRYSETYTFRTHSDAGVRLWVGRRLIIDTMANPQRNEGAGQFKLEAGHWCQIVLELSTKTTGAEVGLFWSSASQRQEIVPQECLYSVLDETAEFAQESHGGRKLMEVGHAIAGESRLPDCLFSVMNDTVEVAPEHQDECELLEVGHAIVGEGRPQTATEFGAPLSDDYAHLFTVMVPAAQVPLASQRQALRKLIEAEKPAHTDFQLCLIEPRMRVGVQARVGIDSIVAGPGPILRLGSASLGHESYLGGEMVSSQTNVTSYCTTECAPVVKI